MFCNQCGLDIPDDSKFCSHCGSAVFSGLKKAGEPPPATQPAADGGDPQFVLKPRFIGWQILLGLPIYAFLGIWGAMFFGGFGEAFSPSNRGFGSGPPVSIPCGLVLFFGVPLIAYTVGKLTYAKTEYRFYKDRLEYTEGFWTVENKVIRYDRIVEITMRRGVIQKAYNLGTIFLATPATGYRQGKAISGINVKDIGNPEDIYVALQKLIGIKPR